MLPYPKSSLRYPIQYHVFDQQYPVEGIALGNFHTGLQFSCNETELERIRHNAYNSSGNMAEASMRPSGESLVSILIQGLLRMISHFDNIDELSDFQSKEWTISSNGV